MGEPGRRGGKVSFLSELFITLLDSESLTGRRFRDIFKPVGGPNRVFDLALDERSTFGTWRSDIKRDLIGEGFSTSPLRFKMDETVGFTRETELAGTEVLSEVVDFCEIEVKMFV
jgi:hypothetical protein